jgi:hypothetical protein
METIAVCCEKHTEHQIHCEGTLLQILNTSAASARCGPGTRRRQAAG